MTYRNAALTPNTPPSVPHRRSEVAISPSQPPHEVDLPALSAAPGADPTGSAPWDALHPLLVQLKETQQRLHAAVLEQTTVAREVENRRNPIFRLERIGTTDSPYRLVGTRPFNRAMSDAVHILNVRFPGLQPFTRVLTPGWNVLDYPEGTELYVDSGSITVGILKSFYPLDQLDPVIPAGYIALNSPPAQTNAGADTPLTFVSHVAHWLIQNNTAATVGFELNQAGAAAAVVASAGSMQIAAGATYTSDIPVSGIHLFTAGAQNINGTAASNIVVRGWA